MTTPRPPSSGSSRAAVRSPSLVGGVADPGGSTPEAGSSRAASRREFFRHALRYSALTGLGALVANAIVRRAPLTGSVCPGSGECRRCTLATDCTRPKTAGPDPKPLSPRSPS